MNKPLIKILTGISLITALTYCKRPEDPKPAGFSKLGKGFFIVNEGNFKERNASISFYDRGTKSMLNNLYMVRNNIELGDQANSMAIYGDKGYIVVQNSNKVEIVDVDYGTSKGKLNLPETVNPRNFLGIDSTKGYLTDWKTNSVMVINLKTNGITSSILTGKGPDQLLKVGNKVFVSNSGGYDADSSITVINSSNNTVEATISVGNSPSSMVLDKDGMLWVLGGGKYKADYTGMEKPGTLTKINTNTNEVLLSISFPLGFTPPNSLTINKTGNKLLYNFEGKVYSHDIASATLPTSSIINRNFYSLAYDTTDNYIIGCLAQGFTSNGKIIRYEFHSNVHAVDYDSMEVGIAPRVVVFK